MTIWFILGLFWLIIHPGQERPVYSCFFTDKLKNYCEREVDGYLLLSKRAYLMFGSLLGTVWFFILIGAFVAIAPKVGINPYHPFNRNNNTTNINEVGNEQTIHRYDLAIKQAEEYLANSEYLMARAEYMRAFRSYKQYATDQQKLDYYLRLAQCNVKLKSHNDAIFCYKMVLQLQPNSFDGNLQMAKEKRKIGEILEALNFIEIARKINSKNIDAKIEAAGLYLNLGKIETSTAILKECLEDDPNSFQALSLQGKIETSKKNFDSAEKLFRRSLVANPNYSNATIGLARLLIVTDRMSEALNHLNSITDNEPENVDALLLKVEIFSSASNYQQVFKIMENIVKNNPDRHILHLKLASLYLRAGMINKAINICEDVLKADPTNVPVQEALAAIFYNLKIFSYAEKHSKIALQQEPGRPKSFRILTLALFSAEKYDEAAVKLVQYLKFKPNDYDIRLRYARTLAHLNKIDDAEKQYQLLAQQKNLNYRAFVILGGFYSKHNKLSKAEAAFRRAYELEPNSSLIINNLCDSLIKQNKDIDFVISKLSKLVEEDPKSPIFKDNLAWAFYQNKQYKKALSLLTSIDKSNYYASSMHHHLAEVYLKLKRYKEARNTFIFVSQQDPNYHDIKTITQRIAELSNITE